MAGRSGPCGSLTSADARVPPAAAAMETAGTSRMGKPTPPTDEVWERTLDRIARLVPLRGARPTLAAPSPALAGPALGVLARTLATAYRGERRRGLAGHWTFDANRLVGLRQALEAVAARRRIMSGKVQEGGVGGEESPP